MTYTHNHIHDARRDQCNPNKSDQGHVLCTTLLWRIIFDKATLLHFQHATATNVQQSPTCSGHECAAIAEPPSLSAILSLFILAGTGVDMFLLSAAQSAGTLQVCYAPFVFDPQRRLTSYSWEAVNMLLYETCLDTRQVVAQKHCRTAIYVQSVYVNQLWGTRACQSQPNSS